MTTLCDATTCGALRSGRPLFLEGDHLSAYGNLLLVPALRATLQPNAALR